MSPQHRVNLVRCSDGRRGTGAFIYALSADENSPALAAFAPQAQPCFPAASNVLALPGGNPIFAATQTERITHYTLLRKVVCQRVPLWKPRFAGVWPHFAFLLVCPIPQNRKKVNAYLPTNPADMHFFFAAPPVPQSEQLCDFSPENSHGLIGIIVDKYSFIGFTFTRCSDIIISDKKG